jgi:hypothetical protein
MRSACRLDFLSGVGVVVVDNDDDDGSIRASIGIGVIVDEAEVGIGVAGEAFFRVPWACPPVSFSSLV